MEKYFKVRPGSREHEACVTWEKNNEKSIEFLNIIAKEFGLEATKFIPYTTELYILPTENDKVKFKDMLKMPDALNGAREFKVRSAVHKRWIELVTESGITRFSKPDVHRWFDSVGKSSSRLFNLGNEWYGSFEVKGVELITPEGLEEIKASQFYLDIETDNELRGLSVTDYEN